MNEELKAPAERLRAWQEWSSNHYEPADADPYRQDKNVTQCAAQHAEDKEELALAYLAEHPEGAPDWYSRAEIFDWLRGKNYCEEIAHDLAELIATNYQLAFNKGFSMGQRQGSDETPAMQTISKPGATLEVKAGPIPPDVQAAISKGLMEGEGR